MGAVVVVRPGEKIPVDGTRAHRAGHGRPGGHHRRDPCRSRPAPARTSSPPASPAWAACASRPPTSAPTPPLAGWSSLVEEAEGHRARGAALRRPLLAPGICRSWPGLAALTLLIRRDPLATAAVLVVACSCSFALATPIAMLASVGAGARRGMLFKGGKYLESLARADVLLVDKTGTLTLGRPQITDVMPLNGLSRDELLALAASAEQYSEHPLAEAVRAAARAESLRAGRAGELRERPRLGRARHGGRPAPPRWAATACSPMPLARRRRARGPGQDACCTCCTTSEAGRRAGRRRHRCAPKWPQALAEARALGIDTIELLTGDNERSRRRRWPAAWASPAAPTCCRRTRSRSSRTTRPRAARW